MERCSRGAVVKIPFAVPPETPDAHFASFARGFFALFDKNLFHFRAEVASEFRGEQAKEHAVAFCGAAFGFGHDVPRAIWTNRFENRFSVEIYERQPKGRRYVGRQDAGATSTPAASLQQVARTRQRDNFFEARGFGGSDFAALRR